MGVRFITGQGARQADNRHVGDAWNSDVLTDRAEALCQGHRNVVRPRNQGRLPRLPIGYPRQQELCAEFVPHACDSNQRPESFQGPAVKSTDVVLRSRKRTD